MATLTKQQYDELINKGLDQATIKNIAQSRGDTLPNDSGIITNFAKGFVKGAIGDVIRPTTQMLQGLGQRALAAIDPTKNLEQVRATTGIKGLDDSTPEGQAEVQALKTSGGAETTGRVVANIASFFVPTSKATQVAGRVAKTTGRLSTRAGIGLSAKEAPLMQTYKAVNSVPQRIMSALKGKDLGRPITNAETAVKNGIFGTEAMIGVKSKRAASNLWHKVISPALKANPTKVDMTAFIDDIAREVDSIPELTRRNEMIEALKAFNDDYGKVGKVTLEKLQAFKQGWAKFLPDKVYKGKPVANAFKDIQNIAAGLARKKIYDALGTTEARVAYFDYGNLKNLQELGQKAMTGSKLKGGAGSFISGLYDKVVTPIATTGGLTLYKVGEGLEFVGGKGAKILGDLFK